MKKHWLALGMLTATVPQLSHAMVDEIFCSYPCGINPGLPPCRECGYTAEVNYLYWKPYQDNNAWANINKPQGNRASNYDGFTYTSDLVNTMRDVKYDWDSGFRVGLGIDLPCYYWTLGVTWTHFDTNATNTANTDLGIISPAFVTDYPTLLSVYDDSTLIGTGKALWRLELNQIDFDIQREIIFGYGITLTPFLGLRTEFLKEKYVFEMLQESVSAVEDEKYVNDLDFKLAYDFKAFGLKAGLKTHFDLFCGLGFYGQFGLASTYGSLDTSQSFEGTLSQYTASTGILDTQEKPKLNSVKEVNCLRTACDLSLGLEWRTLFDCDSSLFFVRFGWEHHTLLNQNNFLSVSNNGAYYEQEMQGGNLYLYGWTFAIGGHF